MYNFLGIYILQLWPLRSHSQHISSKLTLKYINYSQIHLNICKIEYIYCNIFFLFWTHNSLMARFSQGTISSRSRLRHSLARYVRTLVVLVFYIWGRIMEAMSESSKTSRNYYRLNTTATHDLFLPPSCRPSAAAFLYRSWWNCRISSKFHLQAMFWS